MRHGVAAVVVIGANTAIFSVVLGAMGIHGVVSYSVRQRTVEIGIRKALGAEAGALRLMVLREGMLLATIGIMAGLAGAAILGRLMATLLYGVEAFDAISFIAGAIVFLAVAIVASILPAHWAARVAPLEALQSIN